MAQLLINSKRAPGSLIDPMLIQIKTLFPNERVFINIRSKYSYLCSLLLNLANLTEAGISGNDKHPENEFNMNYQFSTQRGRQNSFFILQLAKIGSLEKLRI